MKIQITCFVVFFCLQITSLFAQVGINNTSPNALLDIQSSNQAAPSNTDGILIPKIDEFPAINPTSVQDGMMVYATGSGVPAKGFYFWDTSSMSWKNVSGNGGNLEKITEAGNTGWRLAESNPLHFGNIGYSAVDFSLSNFPDDTYGATGNYSFAGGLENTSSGPYSITFGVGNIASGSASMGLGRNSVASSNYSIAIGDYCISIGQSAIAMGSNNDAVGNHSAAIGYGNKTSAYAETVLGHFGTEQMGAFDSWIETDRLFTIGNGLNNTTRSDALTILKNGTITAPNFDISEITDNKALITKEYADAAYVGVAVEDVNLATLNASWTAYGSGYNDVGYYNHNKRVHTQGLLRKTGGFVAGEVIFILPIGYRPAGRVLAHGGQSGNLVRIDILANGEVRYMSGENGTSDFISLEGISFRVN